MFAISRLDMASLQFTLAMDISEHFFPLVFDWTKSDVGAIAPVPGAPLNKYKTFSQVTSVREKYNQIKLQKVKIKTDFK